MRLQNLPGVPWRPDAETEPTYSLSFQVEAATLRESFGHQEFELKAGEIPKQISLRSIGLTLQYGGDYHPIGGVSLSDGTKLKDNGGHCRIFRRTEENGHDAPVGVIQYSPAFKDKDPALGHSFPSHFDVDLYLPSDRFDDIVANLRLGQLPSSFEVRVRGMSLKTEFEYLWDVGKTPLLPIIYFYASFVAAVDDTISKENKPFKQTVKPSYYPVSQSDFTTLVETIRAQSSLIEKLAGKLDMVVFGIALVAVITIWRAIGH